MHENNYDTEVINAILSDKKTNITEVHNLSSIKSMLFDRAQYSNIIELVKSCNWIQISSLVEVSAQGFREYLDIVTFADQNQRSVVATIYDSDALWQDPQIIEIFFLNS